MDKNSLSVCFPPFCKNKVQNSATEHESQRAHGTKDSPPKTNPSHNCISIKVYHGQELTSCVFPPFCKNNVQNSATEQESQRAHGTKDSPPKTNPSPHPQLHKSIPWTWTHRLCISPPFFKNNVQNSATEQECQRAHSTKDRPVKTNRSHNHSSTNIHHGQALTSCVFSPIVQKPRPKQCNRTRKSAQCNRTRKSEVMAQSTVLPKLNPSSNLSFIKIYHGQELTH